MAATSPPSLHVYQDSPDGKAWFNQRSKLEELLQPFTTAEGAVVGGAATFLQNKRSPEPKHDPREKAPPPEPKPVETPSFTAHLAGWDQALIGIGDARRNNISKKPLLPVR